MGRGGCRGDGGVALPVVVGNNVNINNHRPYIVLGVVVEYIYSMCGFYCD